MQSHARCRFYVGLHLLGISGYRPTPRFRHHAQVNYADCPDATHDFHHHTVRNCLVSTQEKLFVQSSRVLNERAGRVPYAITTPEHGTAFDIAGKGIAKTKATEEAIRIAAQMSAPKA